MRSIKVTSDMDNWDFEAGYDSAMQHPVILVESTVQKQHCYEAYWLSVILESRFSSLLQRSQVKFGSRSG